jgi:hypothetical protein
LAASGFGQFICQDLELDFGNRTSGLTTDFASGIIAFLARTRFIRCRFDTLTTMAQSLHTYQCYHSGYTRLFGGAYVVMNAGAHNSHVQSNASAYVALDYDELFEGGAITIFRGGTIEVGTACIFRKNGAAVGINPGGTLIAIQQFEGISALWGTANTNGLTINTTGNLLYQGGRPPTVNAGLGLGREILLGQTNRLYSELPIFANGSTIAPWTA